ncbi:hypothetical protein F750_0413 [Streptomyces sp. PAMC 26508]|nr:hypothetical protein F750_0413 [Streptomyces sp. PAMC 26508]
MPSTRPKSRATSVMLARGAGATGDRGPRSVWRASWARRTLT